MHRRSFPSNQDKFWFAGHTDTLAPPYSLPRYLYIQTMHIYVYVYVYTNIDT